MEKIVGPAQSRSHRTTSVTTTNKPLRRNHSEIKSTKAATPLLSNEKTRAINLLEKLDTLNQRIADAVEVKDYEFAKDSDREFGGLTKLATDPDYRLKGTPKRIYNKLVEQNLDATKHMK